METKQEGCRVLTGTIKECGDILRKDIKLLETKTRELLGNECFKDEQRFQNQHSEMKANIMLIVRHLEDARMRIGKLLQYADDGVSILDK